MPQSDLFLGQVPYPNVSLEREVMPHSDSEHIAGVLRSLPWERREFRDGVMMPRMECLVGPPGYAYTYSGITYQAAKLGPDLAEITADLIGFASSLAKHEFNAVFFNLYRTNRDSIGWHSDDEPSLGRPEEVVIASLSFGATRSFQMRLRDDHSVRHDWRLGSGDFFVMGAGCQSSWEHQAPKSAVVSGRRISATFRTVRR